MTAHSITRTVSSAVKKSKTWNATAWLAASMTSKAISRTVTAIVKKGAWNNDAWAAANMTNSSNSVTLTVNVAKKTTTTTGSDEGGGGSTSGGGTGRGRGRSLGGIFNNGIWSSIPQYARGTANAHGSLFLAGEAGPEIVGHVGGRTEVLNRSQLAATMYSAVRSAMGGVRLTLEAGDGGAQDSREADYETMYRAMYDAFSAAMARGDERDREKVALLRQISEKEFRTDISTSDINRAQTRANRRAGITVVPVGT